MIQSLVLSTIVGAVVGGAIGIRVSQAATYAIVKRIYLRSQKAVEPPS